MREARTGDQGFVKMGVTPSCTCTPYLVGNQPGRGDHIAWSESSAVAYANSILGAIPRIAKGDRVCSLRRLLGGRLATACTLKKTASPKSASKSTPSWLPSQISGPSATSSGRRLGRKFHRLKESKVWTLSASRFVCVYSDLRWDSPLPHPRRNLPPEGIGKPHNHGSGRHRGGGLHALNDETVEVDFVAFGCPHCTLDEIKTIAEPRRW